MSDSGAGVHHFVPMLHRRDAVGEHTRTIRDLLVAEGIPSRIYVDLPDAETEAKTRPYTRYREDARPGDVLVYQVATSSEIAGWLSGRSEPLVLNYHSITPPHFFAPWSDGIARLQAAALIELADLAPRSVLGIADSAYNAAELTAAGCPDTRVVPVSVPGLCSVEPDPVVSAELAPVAEGRGPWWLSVGRMAPNKAHHDTIAALFVARSTSAPGSHLTIVGSPSEPHYAAALRRYAADLGVSDAVEFVSGVSESELAARYERADVLVLLSDHEGFGVPLVEAMAHGLPIVAHDAGAVSEVLGDAGVLLTRKGPRQVSAAVDAVVGDPGRRAEMEAVGRRRVGELGLDRAGADLVAALVEVARRAVSPAAPGAPSRPVGAASH